MENWLSNLKNKIAHQISNNTNTKKLVTELEKLNQELAIKSNQVKSYLEKEKTKKVKSAEANYKLLMKQIKLTQKQLDKEVKKAVSQLKTSALKVEKNIETYKKTAIQQKEKLENKWFKKTTGTSAKKTKTTATKKKASKAISRKKITKKVVASSAQK